MQRVLIIGAPGAGKTTLASKLGKITGLPVFGTDGMIFRDVWEYRASDEALQLVTDATEQERWIIEGAYLDGFEHRVGRADHVIILSTPALERMKRIFFRWSNNYRYQTRRRGTGHGTMIWRLIRQLRMTTVDYPSHSAPVVFKVLDDASDDTKIYHVKTLAELEKVYGEAQYYAGCLSEGDELARP